MSTTRWVTVALVAVGLLSLVAGGCADDDPCAQRDATARVTDGHGTPLHDFVAIFSSVTEDAIGIAHCPVSTASLACHQSGEARMTAAPSPLEVVAKARGYMGGIIQKSSGSTGSQDRCARDAKLQLTLEPLGAFEQTVDYVTGFGADSDLGMAQFSELAVATPTESGDALSVKFYIDNIHGGEQGAAQAARDGATVYFQNTKEHPLHFGFVRTALGRAISLTDYEAQTYRGLHRPGMAGTVVFYPQRVAKSRFLGASANGTIHTTASTSAAASASSKVEAPFTVEFFPSDDLTPEQALTAHQLIEERMLFVPLSGTNHRLFYVPATSAHERAMEEAELQHHTFAKWHAAWMSRDELHGNIEMQLLNPGKACGTLSYVSPDDLLTTPVSHRDILLLSRLPNAVPLVGGTISEELQTPLAHVNVAARARGTPNLALLRASTDPRVQPLIDALVCFEVTLNGFALYEVTLTEAEAHWATLTPPDPLVPTADLTVTGLWDFADLGFADSNIVGAKAANLAELRAVLGDTTPNGFAIPFYYYDQFINAAKVDAAGCDAAHLDCQREGRALAACDTSTALCDASALAAHTIAEHIDMLLADPDFATDTLTREAALNGLRYIMHHVDITDATSTNVILADFAAALDAKAFALLGNRRIRLRSSTNAEDLETFSGAGLYRSVSAQMGTAEPPSAEVRKVWASVWSWQAFEEREYWNIDHRATKMGVAVHRSFPDEDANGVLITQSIANPAITGFYVNVQLGEESVTNPEGGVLPEVFTVIPGGTGVTILRDRFSSLSPSTPVMTDPEVTALVNAALQVQQHFVVLYGESPGSFALEIEFKLIPPARILVIKQARPYFQR